MKLATIRLAGGATAAVTGRRTMSPTETGFGDVGDLLAQPRLARCRGRGDGTRLTDLADVEYATLVAKPDKVLCVGLNYR